MKIVIFLSFCLALVSCADVNRPTLDNKLKADLYIKEYIQKESASADYQELQRIFLIFYNNAVKCERQYYPPVDSSKGELFFGLDSLIIFNASRDSALLFYIKKVKNETDYNFHYRTPKLFAYRTAKGWRFYDGCESAVYIDELYTVEMARQNERLWLAFDSEWLNWKNEQISENPQFIQHACKMWCGPCLRDSLNMELYLRVNKERTPPDSLYRYEEVNNRKVTLK